MATAALPTAAPVPAGAPAGANGHTDLSTATPAEARRHHEHEERDVIAAVAEPDFSLPAPPLELDTVAARWQRALDSAQRALQSASFPHGLTPAEIGRHGRALALERQQTAQSLKELAHLTGVRSAPWLAPGPVGCKSLGLPDGVQACLFDLDGVLTSSNLLHAACWREVFDELLRRRGEGDDWYFVPFDRDDYQRYLDGRPRLEGVHAFLASRGLRLPEGRPDDAASAETAYGLARHKQEVLARHLHAQGHGLVARTGARRYLEAAGHAGLKRAVISASTSTRPILAFAHLEALLETRVDADVIRQEGLRSRPEPDMLLAACERLGVEPERTVTFVHAPAGVVAGQRAGLAVIGVGDRQGGPLAGELASYGAARVVQGLDQLLDRALLEL